MFPVLVADLADSDHDGVANVIEYAFNLDPKKPDAGSLPVAQARAGELVIEFTAPSGVTAWHLEWNSIPGAIYRIQGSTDLVNWVDATDDISGLGATTAAYVYGSGGSYYWRVVRYY